MVIKLHSHINAVSVLWQSGAELTVILKRQEPDHCLALTPAPGRLQSCSSAGGGQRSGHLKGQHFF